MISALKNLRIARIYREIRGLETIQKTANCKSANYESANCKDSLYVQWCSEQTGQVLFIGVKWPFSKGRGQR